MEPDNPAVLEERWESDTPARWQGLAASLCELASLRAELAATELHEEKRELVKILLGAAALAALATATLLFAALALLAIAWDSPQRGQIALSLFAFLGTGLAWLVMWLRRQLDRTRPPFSRTIGELHRDATFLRTFQS